MLKQLFPIRYFVTGYLRNSIIRMSSSEQMPAMAENAASSGEMSGNVVESKDGTEKGVKRSTEGFGDDGIVNKKQRVTDQTDSLYIPYKKKKVAMLMVYSGKGYFGMQRNPDTKTIEGDLLEALVKAGVCRDISAKNPGAMMKFQRAARTDKGVSAVGQVVSSMIFVDVDSALEKINSHLSPQIRVLGIKRATKGFDSKQACDARTYTYTLPTFAFTPIDQLVKEDFKITDDIIDEVNGLLKLYHGTHNFHNFTSGKKAEDKSAFRYIMDFKMGKPFIRDGLELAVLSVKGQSFMLHQIRKMIGLVIAIQRGLADKESIELAWGNNKRDIPKCPGLGLLLERLHYDWYNRKFGKDGYHEKIDCEEFQEEIAAFKEKYIFPTLIQTEKEEKSMLKWLSTLHLHHFQEITDFRISPSEVTGIGQANKALYEENKSSKEVTGEADKGGDSKEATVGEPVVNQQVTGEADKGGDSKEATVGEPVVSVVIDCAADGDVKV